MSNEKLQSRVKTLDIAMVGVFAAISYLGVQVFRIPFSFIPGVPFVHFGNILILLGALLMGPKRGAIAGPLGFAIFDILNGYLQVLPKVVIVASIMCAVCAVLFSFLRGRIGSTFAILCSSAAAFIISLTGDFLYEAGLFLLSGSSMEAAASVAFTSLLATAINALFGIAVLPILYPLVAKAMSRAGLKLY